MTTETENPAKIINNQTFRDNGSKNANRLTDFSGAFTNKMLIPRSRNGIEKSTTYRIESFCYISNLFHSLIVASFSLSHSNMILYLFSVIIDGQITHGKVSSLKTKITI